MSGALEILHPVLVMPAAVLQVLFVSHQTGSLVYVLTPVIMPVNLLPAAVRRGLVAAAWRSAAG
jgi:hypothetical protein